MRAAVVGAGFMGRRHVHTLRRIGVKVAAIVDLDGDSAASLARRVGAGTHAYSSFAECLDEQGVDVVHICTPIGAHVALAQAAIDHGCHVLVEKPLAPSSSEMKEVLAAAREAGVLLNPVHQFPFQRGVKRILARRHELGELVSVTYRTSTAGAAGLPAQQRPGLLREILPHAASLFHRFAPGFDAASCRVDAQAEDLVVSGCAGTTRLEAFITCRGRPPRNELEIIGTRSSAVADLYHGFAVFDRVPVSGKGKALRPFALGARILGNAGLNSVYRLARREPSYPGLRQLVSEFYAAVAAGSSPPISDAEMLAAAMLMDAAPKA